MSVPRPGAAGGAWRFGARLLVFRAGVLLLVPGGCRAERGSGAREGRRYPLLTLTLTLILMLMFGFGRSRRLPVLSLVEPFLTSPGSQDGG